MKKILLDENLPKRLKTNLMQLLDMIQRLYIVEARQIKDSEHGVNDFPNI